MEGRGPFRNELKWRIYNCLLCKNVRLETIDVLDNFERIFYWFCRYAFVRLFKGTEVRLTALMATMGTSKMTFLLSKTESIELLIEDQAFLRSYDLAPRPPPSPISPQPIVSLSQSSCVSPVELTDGREWAMNQIMRPRESLALYL
jgi:hypothetical protein